MTCRTLALVMAAAMAVGVGCRGRDDSKPAEPAATAGSGSGAEVEPIDGPPKRVALTPQRLAPVIQELGLERVVPTALVIELATPIIDGDRVGGESTKSVVKITPATPGQLRYSSVSGLTFTPHQPFAFETTYTVELQKLETRDGVLEPAAGTTWTHTFKTPKFELLSWAPTELDVLRNKVTMEIAFSGAVLPHVAQAQMKLAVGGKRPAGVQVMRSARPNVVVVQLTDPAIKLGAKLTLATTKNLPSIAGTLAPPAKAEFVIANDKAVSIKAVEIVEGANGFYLEVVCDDKAATAGSRSHYAGGTYHRLSSRCQLTDEAAKRITFSPAVKGAYVAGGRAGFRVFGDFKRGAYKMKVPSGVTSIDGGVLLAPYATSFAVKARRPALAFAASGRYLPRTAWNNLGIKHTNVDAVNLVVRHIPAENLVFWMSGQQDAADERTSNLILQKTIPLRGDADASATTYLDVAAMLPATTKGVLELKLIGLGVQATSRLLLTNMSLVAKKATTPNKPWEQTVRVWALDMDSGALLEGVDVSLVRMSGKAVGRCTTEGGAGCTLSSKSDTDPDQAEPFAIVARKGDDLTYIRYSDLKATVAESNTAGQPYVSDTPYRAAVFADRGVYRPGDTAHVVAIVRDAKDRAPDQVLPVDVKLIDPRSKVARKLTLQTNAGGVIAFDHALPAFADTGHWRVQYSVADKPLASYSLQVEEFVPERMAVDVAAKQDELLAGSKVELAVSARYLFGGNAMDSGVEATCSVAPTRFEPAENADLTYGVAPRGKEVGLGTARGQLDLAGTLTLACPEAPTPFTTTADVTATVSVLEAGSGRATVRTASATLHPEKFYIGLKSKATRAVAGDPFTVEGMIVDWTGNPVASAVTKLDIELLHLEADYGYGYDEYSGEERYDRSMREVPEGKRTVAVTNGRFAFEVTPGSSPVGYAVRVKAGKAKTELVLDGEYPYEYYGYGDGDSVDATPRPARPTQLALDLPPEIALGKPVTVKVKTPYKGKLLWTIETNELVKAEWRDATGAEATWSFTVDAFAPNVYVSAFLVKDPHLESKDAFMPDRALGVASARVTPAAFTQDVKIAVPKEIRSSSALQVALDLGPVKEPTFATIAVVDEGILSLTHFKTPNPLLQLFAKRALGVETFETIGWTMLHQAAGASSRTGGGDDYGEGESGGELDNSRVQPVKPVALFSGVVPVPANGKLTVPFAVPSYRGKLRVMAITASATRVGRAEAHVLVRDPLVVQVTFPRFVTHGDELQIPVFLTNVSGGPLDVALTLTSEHVAVAGVAAPKATTLPIAFTGKHTGTVRLMDGRAETLVFAAKAAIPIGGGKLRVVARARGKAIGALEVTDEVEVPFLPAGPKERTIQKLKVQPGTLNLATLDALKGWTPTSETTTFWLTTNPYGEAFEHLKYLVHYPYGCIEQTTSTTRPLLYVGALVEQGDPMATLKIEDMILAGINRVLSMETPSGGFGYWPGSTEPLEWATAYATHMLLDARKAGYAVPDDRLKAILGWIEDRVAQHERGARIQRDTWNHYDEQAEAYLHYVLAVAGKGKKARIQKLIAQIPATATGEQAEDRYLLMAALYLAGDRRFARELKTVDTSPIQDDRVNSWSFYSDRRRRGLMLATFFDLFGNAPEGELLATRVAEGLTGRASYYYNTQELVWGVTGLGKWVKAAAAKGIADATLRADGALIQPRKARTATPGDRAWALRRASDYATLTLDVAPQAAGLWLVINSEGVRPGNTYKVGGNGLAITRTYRDADGTALDISKPDALQLGDVVFVDVELANTSGAVIQNIALVDRLPAGFEIENPRLGRTQKIEWVEPSDLWAMDFMNMRDDRVQVFGALAPGARKKVVYSVRAVTSGSFTVPPVEAEAMYDPTLWARAKGGSAIVGGPWTGKTL